MRSVKSSLYRKNKLNFLLALIGSIGNAAIAVGVAFLLREFVDISITGFMESLYHMIRMFILLLLVMILVDVVSFVFTNRFICRGMQQYKHTLFKGLLQRSISSFQKEASAQCMSALSNDASVIEKNYLEATFELCTYAMMFAAGLGSMLYLDSYLTMCVIAASLAPLLVSVLFTNALQNAERSTSNRNAGFIGLLKDLFSGFTVIKSFQAEPVVLDTFEKENAMLEKTKKHRRDLISVLTLLSQISGFLVNLVVFGLGAWLCIQKVITAGTVIAFVQLLNYIIAPIEKLPALYSVRKASAALMEKSEAILQEEQPQANETALQDFRQAITLEHVNFSYEEGKQALSDINIRFEKGKRYAVVGASGSGKSTLLQLLLGYDRGYEGNIFIDTVELNTLSRDSLYHLISIVQQNVFVFNATLLDNITMFQRFPPAITSHAMKCSGLYELVQEKGNEYLCGENGCHLSGGEKQRISIARSLIRNAQILMMDEATAALDNGTARMVEQSILQLRDVTAIVVTHKLHADMLRQYDQILVMKDGHIEEAGTFEELYSKKGCFYSLYRLSV